MILSSSGPCAEAPSGGGAPLAPVYYRAGFQPARSLHRFGHARALFFCSVYDSFFLGEVQWSIASLNR